LPLTRQQLFDKALTVARQQNRPCMNERGWNIFHHKKLRSFTGAWIPIDIGHDVEINTMSSEEFIRVFPEFFNIADEVFICELEYIHDAFSPAEWEHHFEQLARHYDLAYQQKGNMKWQPRRAVSPMHLRAS